MEKISKELLYWESEFENKKQLFREELGRMREEMNNIRDEPMKIWNLEIVIESKETEIQLLHE